MKFHFVPRAIVRVAALTALVAAGTLVAPTLHAQDIDATESAQSAPPAPSDNSANSPTMRPLSITIDLIGGSKLEGTLTDTTILDVQTSFGSANVPLSEVAGIRFGSAESGLTTVVMLNGDSITGTTDVDRVTVETQWGIAQINGPNIASMLFVPGLSWTPESGLNGQRWKLTNVTAAPSSSTSTSSAVSSSGSSNSSSVISAPSSSYRNGRRYYGN